MLFNSPPVTNNNRLLMKTKTRLAACLMSFLIIMPGGLVLAQDQVRAQGTGQDASARPTTDQIQAQREQIGLLKKASFADLRDLHALDLQSEYPAQSRVSLYLGAPVINFTLQQVSVSFDGQAPTTTKYNAQEIKALDDGHIYRAARVNLAPGAHRVSVKYTGTLVRPILDDKQISGEITVPFEKTIDQVTRLAVPIVPDVFGIDLLTNPKAWVADKTEQDLRLGMTRYLRATGQEYAALINLLEMAGLSSGSQTLPLAYDMELAHSYVDFGMREQADQAMRIGFDTGISLSELADVWLRVAKLDYQREDLTRAYALLQYLDNDLAPAHLVRWQDTVSRLLMSEGQYEQAREVLERGDNATEVLTDAEVPEKQTIYMRYNYAVALIKTGEVARGRTLLERIGRITSFGEDQRALRDKANLLLAYNFLEEEQGATGKNIIERIRLDGPYSNEALLLLGWAELAPRGTSQPRALVGDEPDLGEYGSRKPEAGRIIKKNQPIRLRDDPFTRIQMGDFRMARTADSKKIARSRALVAWTEVAQDSPQDPAVQEALIAVPYVVSALGQPSRAFQDYLKAIELLEQSRAELGGYISASSIDLDAIDRGDLSQLPDTPWMRQFLAEKAFDEHFQNYLIMRRLHEDLRRLSTTGNKGLGSRLSGYSQSDYKARAQRLQKLSEALMASAQVEADLARHAVVTEITKQRKRLDQYLIAARLGVARFQEAAQTEQPISPLPEEEKGGSGFWPF